MNQVQKASDTFPVRRQGTRAVLAQTRMLGEVSSKIPLVAVKLQAKNVIAVHDLQKIIGPATLFKASPAKQLNISAPRVSARHSGRASERLRACKGA